MQKYHIIEVTKENEQLYLNQISQLECKVLENMEREGKNGQLFITGEEDISKYIHSKENKVIVAPLDENNRVIAATYITQGQKPFTYNDITKYFKYGDGYKKHIKSQYPSEIQYKNDVLDIYKVKLKAFESAKNRVMQEYPEFNGNIEAFLQHELDDPQSQFHEKSVLREKLNEYMSEYIEEENERNPGIKEKYEQFYWVTLEDIAKEFNKNPNEMRQENTTKEYELLQSQNETDMQYQDIIKKSRIKNI